MTKHIATRTLSSHVQNLTLHQLRQVTECKPLFFSATQMVHPSPMQQHQQQMITTEHIHKLCKLARLAVPEKQEALEKLKRDLNEVISCLNQLPQDIDSSVPPTYSPLQLYGRENHLAQRWRSDHVAYLVNPKNLLEHAPFTKANCFVVKTKATTTAAGSPDTSIQEEF